jgi:hypothetical protein
MNSLYAYVGGNPASLTDPLGLCFKDDLNRWGNNLLSFLFAPWGGYSNFVSDLQQTGWPGGSWDATLAGLPLPPVVAVEGAAVDLEEMSANAVAEAIAEGRSFTPVSLGANPMNFSASINSAEAEANLLSNGYRVEGVTSTGGNYLSNGTNYYSFYGRTSTQGTPGMVFNGNAVKYNLPGP